MLAEVRSSEYSVERHDVMVTGNLPKVGSWTNARRPLVRVRNAHIQAGVRGRASVRTKTLLVAYLQ
jgi:hypothetical protein